MNLLQFSDRAAFRSWLTDHCLSNDGVWLLLDKAGGPKTLTANEALEEALCFGWIDGQIQSLGDVSYKNYFARRLKNSKWSEKNKALVVELELRGLLTDYGKAKIAEAKQNGQWTAPKALVVVEEQIAALADLLKGHEPIYANFEAMFLSVQKTYTKDYLERF